jgi:hypothetical protein
MKCLFSLFGIASSLTVVWIMLCIFKDYYWNKYKEGNKYKEEKLFPFMFITGLIIIIFITLLFLNYYATNYFFPDSINDSIEATNSMLEKLGLFGDSAGIVNALFTALAFGAAIYTLLLQKAQLDFDRKTTSKEKIESHFFKMLDCHNNIVNQLIVSDIIANKCKNKSQGRRAFVIFKKQLRKLIVLLNDFKKRNSLNLDKRDIANIAYITFYYGLYQEDGQNIEWKESMRNIIKENEDEIIEQLKIEIQNNNYRIDRTNETSLSSYFRNMYSAIRLVDDSKLLSIEEKKNLIELYKAQLSDPELYVLLFHLLSNFGKEWTKKGYIENYELLKYLPKKYREYYCTNDCFK